MSKTEKEEKKNVVLLMVSYVQFPIFRHLYLLIPASTRAVRFVPFTSKIKIFKREEIKFFFNVMFSE